MYAHKAFGMTFSFTLHGPGIFFEADTWQLGWSFTIHGISEFDPPHGALLGAKIAAADFVACVSRYTRSEAMARVDQYRRAASGSKRFAATTSFT